MVLNCQTKLSKPIKTNLVAFNLILKEKKIFFALKNYPCVHLESDNSLEKSKLNVC